MLKFCCSFLIRSYKNWGKVLYYQNLAINVWKWMWLPTYSELTFNIRGNLEICCLTYTSHYFSLFFHKLHTPLLTVYLLYWFISLLTPHLYILFVVNDRHSNFPGYQWAPSLLCDHSHCYKTGEKSSI